MSDKLHLNFTGDAAELVIREGAAEPIHVQPAISLSGNFNAPAEFVNKRTTSFGLDNFANEQCHVIFSEKDLSIKLVAGEQERSSITVTGSLKKNPFLESLRINQTGHKHTDLLSLIRFKPHFFVNRDDHRKLVMGLQNFEVKTESDHKAQNDRQGTVENRQFTKAQSTLTGMNLVLNVPLFEGYEPAPISLTIEVEPNNGSVLLYLVSETFEEFYDDAVKAQFAAQRPVFKSFVIIEK